MDILYSRVLLISVSLPLLLGTWTAKGDETPHELPLRGVVHTVRSGLNLRSAPPTASPFSYRLAEKICTLGNGTEFVASGRAYIANGEVWYRVEISRLRPVKRSPCPAEPQLAGWIVAKTKSSWLIRVLDEALPPQEEELTTPLAAGQEDSRSHLLLNYILLLVGTASAVCVVSIESAGAISPSRWFSRIALFEFGVLAVANLVTAGLLIDQLLVVDNPSLIFRLFKILQGTTGGFALLGFLLSIVLLRFISFARKQQSKAAKAQAQ